jgi:hypothetical protein
MQVSRSDEIVTTLWTPSNPDHSSILWGHSTQQPYRTILAGVPRLTDLQTFIP